TKASKNHNQGGINTLYPVGTLAVAHTSEPLRSTTVSPRFSGLSFNGGPAVATLSDYNLRIFTLRTMFSPPLEDDVISLSDPTYLGCVSILSFDDRPTLPQGHVAFNTDNRSVIIARQTD